MARTISITNQMIRGWVRGTIQTAPDDAGSVATIRVESAGSRLRMSWCSFDKTVSHRQFAAFVRSHGCKAIA